MQIVDTKTTYFDDDGKPLAGGRLRYFAFGTTTPVVVYADSDFITALGTTVALTSAGWTATEIHAQQSVTCHVDRYLGMDEYGAEQYEQIKVYNYQVGASSGTGGDGTSVDTIDELRDIATAPGLAVTVKGYYNAYDSFPRTYLWNENSSAVDNLGTVIESNTDPTGRWVLSIDGPYVDCRIFGVIAGLQTTNSAFSQLFGYCAAVKKIAYFVTGQYYFTSGGSITVNCGIKADRDAVINSQNGVYTLTCSNPKFDIYNTFAGTGLDLLLAGGGWEQTVVPVSAFTNGTHCQGTAHYILRLNSNNITFSTGFQYAGIIVDDAMVMNVTVNPGVEINTPKIGGLGKIAYQTSNTFYVDYLHTSRLSGREGYAMDRTLKVVYVETDVTMPSGIDISASIVDAGGSITCGPMAQGGSITILRGAIDCRPGFLRGTVGFKLFGTIDVTKFDNADLAVKTWIFSTESYPTLDLKGITSSATISRAGTISNGTIGKVTANCTLINVNVSGDAECGNISATDCRFLGENFEIYSGGNLTRCYVENANTPELEDTVLQDVTFTGPVICRGGRSTWRDVSCPVATLIGSGDESAGINFCNFSWVGGSAVTINFDASLQLNTGSATGYNIIIKEIKNLSGGINAINGSTKKWATSGHYNIQIGDNESGKRTYGTVTRPLTATGGSADGWKTFVAYIADLFSFNSDETTPVSWSARAFLSTDLTREFQTYAGVGVNRALSNNCAVWTRQFANYVYSTAADKAHITFKEY